MAAKLNTEGFYFMPGPDTSLRVLYEKGTPEQTAERQAVAREVLLRLAELKRQVAKAGVVDGIAVPKDLFMLILAHRHIDEYVCGVRY